MFKLLFAVACIASALDPPADPTSPIEPQSSIDRAVIRRVVKQYTPAIRSCYDQALARNPTFTGRMTVRWQIETDGSVSKAEVLNLPAEDSLFGTCIVGVLRGMKFPKMLVGPVIISYPFVLSNEPEPQRPLPPT